MSKKIGEVLLERRLVTPVQLETALKTQVMLGGHLGTCLIELGYIDERVFGRTLAELHGLGYAEPEALRNIPPEVARILTWKMAERYKMVPFALKDRQLHLAVTDPSNRDRISTLIRCEIVPFISPEFRIYEAMETYYDIERRPRYIKLCNKLAAQKKERDNATTQPVPVVAAKTGDEPVEQSSNSTVESHGSPEHDTAGQGFGYTRAWRDVSEGLFDPASEQTGATDRKPAQKKAPRKVASKSAKDRDIYEQLRQVEHAKDLSRIVIEHFASHAATCIVFRVKADEASIWDWHGLDLEQSDAQSMVFPVTSGSIFTLMRGDGIYLGPVPENGDCRLFYTALRLATPKQVLLMPVYIEDRLVSIVYVDGGKTGNVPGTNAEYEGLARSLSYAFHMLILRMKIGPVLV